jgi:hypothetical protein
LVSDFFAEQDLQVKQGQNNWSALREISARVESMQKSGSLGFEQWRALFDEAARAAGNRELTEFMTDFASSGWIDRLASHESLPVPVSNKRPDVLALSTF